MHIAQQQGVADKFHVDSAGTHDFHIGKQPDARAIKAAAKHGVDLTVQRARQFQTEDFERFDHIIVMDQKNRANLDPICPPQHAHKIVEMASFDPKQKLEYVPDPFHGEEEDFDAMMDLLFELADHTLQSLVQVQKQ